MTFDYSSRLPTGYGLGRKPGFNYAVSIPVYLYCLFSELSLTHFPNSTTKVQIKLPKFINDITYCLVSFYHCKALFIGRLCVFSR